MKNNNTSNNKTPNITLSVFKNGKPKDNYTLVLLVIKQNLLDVAKMRLREACLNETLPSKDMFTKELKKYDFGLTLQNNAKLVDAGITYDEFESYRDRLKVDLKKWIERKEALNELFVTLLLDNEQQRGK